MRKITSTFQDVWPACVVPGREREQDRDGGIPISILKWGAAVFQVLYLSKGKIYLFQVNLGNMIVGMHQTDT